MSLLAPTLQAFFTDRLIHQRDASPKTIKAYRDTFRLLLRFIEEETGRQPFLLDLADLDAPLIGAFLTHLEHDRGNSPRTRNARLAAIHSFCKYAALRHPEHAATIARVIEIPSKRYDRTDVTYLTEPEIDAVLAAPNRTTWLGRRDHTLMLTAVTTGLRVAELIALRIGDVTTSPTGHIRVLGKGRKNRTTPLKAETATVLSDWLHERQGDPNDPVFPTRQGRALSQVSPSSSPNTPLPRQITARHSPANASPRTSSDTPTQCSSKPNTSTSRRSRSGSATRASRPPTSTSTPTRTSNKKRSTGPPRSAPHPADTNPPTRSSRSSTPSRLSRPANHPDPHRSRENNAVNRPSRDNRKVGIKAGLAWRPPEARRYLCSLPRANEPPCASSSARPRAGIGRMRARGAVRRCFCFRRPNEKRR
jgi:site-specific recombinase XerD